MIKKLGIKIIRIRFEKKKELKGLMQKPGWKEKEKKNKKVISTKLNVNRQHAPTNNEKDTGKNQTLLQ
jgi:CO dehydrogenase/acetyl-CoA synthase alpha subunit